MTEPTVWQKLAAPLPKDRIDWRIDGKPKGRDGKFFARFVAYIDAHFVRERLDEASESDWESRLTPLPQYDVRDRDGVIVETVHVFKGALTIKGVTREDVGEGDSAKSAATDAFKRAAVRFGVGAELYAMGANWVEVDGDGKYAKAIEDPQAAYIRAQQKKDPAIISNVEVPGVKTRAPRASDEHPAPASTTTVPAQPGDNLVPTCPGCDGDMYDNRPKKRSGAFSSKAPDWKCKDKSCDKVWWTHADAVKAQGVPAGEKFRGAIDNQDDDLPF